MSPSTHQPPSRRSAARLTTSRSCWNGCRSTTTSPALTTPPYRTSSWSPCWRVGTIDGPVTSASPNGAADLPRSLSCDSSGIPGTSPVRSSTSLSLTLDFCPKP
ncbi:exported hypothetical protein [Streptomyces misionensis JCM 4497]